MNQGGVRFQALSASVCRSLVRHERERLRYFESARVALRGHEGGWQESDAGIRAMKEEV